MIWQIYSHMLLICVETNQISSSFGMALHGCRLPVLAMNYKLTYNKTIASINIISAFSTTIYLVLGRKIFSGIIVQQMCNSP